MKAQATVLSLLLAAFNSAGAAPLDQCGPASTVDDFGRGHACTRELAELYIKQPGVQLSAVHVALSHPPLRLRPRK